MARHLRASCALLQAVVILLGIGLISSGHALPAAGLADSQKTASVPDTDSQIAVGQAATGSSIQSSTGATAAPTDSSSSTQPLVTGPDHKAPEEAHIQIDPLVSESTDASGTEAADPAGGAAADVPAEGSNSGAKPQPGTHSYYARMYDATRMNQMLQKAQQQLLSGSARGVAAAVRTLHQLAIVLDEVTPAQAVHKAVLRAVHDGTSHSPRPNDTAIDAAGAVNASDASTEPAASDSLGLEAAGTDTAGGAAHGVDSGEQHANAGEQEAAAGAASSNTTAPVQEDAAADMTAGQADPAGTAATDASGASDAMPSEAAEGNAASPSATAAAETAADAPAASVTMPSAHEVPEHVVMARYQGTGVQVAAEAAFMLTALQHAGVLPVPLPSRPGAAPSSASQAGEGDAAGHEHMAGTPGDVMPGHSGEAASAAASRGATSASTASTAATGQAHAARSVSMRPLPTSELLMQLHRQAHAGSQQALLSLADRYFSGFGVQRDCWMGARYARLAGLAITAEAERESRFSAYMAPVELRERHINLRYVSAEEAEDAAHVVHMEEDMAIRGNVDAQRRMAYRRLVGRGIDADPEGAFHDFQAGAAQGDPYAIFNLGYMYVRGLHVPQDFAEAQRLFLQAAEQGFAPAWNALGVMAWGGQGQPANMSVAVEMFERGAAANQSDSLYNLGLMHVYGSSVPQNNTAAAELFLRADAAGHWRAALDVAGMYEDGSGLPQNCRLAEQFYRKYVQERSAWAATMSSAHKATQEGYDWEALAVYLVLAEQGSAVAAANAAFLLRQGRGYTGPGYLDLAARLYERAALQNHTTSAVELGHLLLEAPQLRLSRQQLNPNKSLTWWAAAARHNDSEALFLLGWAAHVGLGTDGAPHLGPEGFTNTTRARHYYEASINAAGTARGRARPARLALAVLQLDAWLQPLLGPEPATRVCLWFRDTVLQTQWVLPPTSYDHHEAVMLASTSPLGGAVATEESVTAQLATDRNSHGDDAWQPHASASLAEEVQKAVVQGLQEMQASWYEAGLTSSDFENLVVTCALGALLVVLLLRKRQQLAGAMPAHELQQHEREWQQLQRRLLAEQQLREARQQQQQPGATAVRQRIRPGAGHSTGTGAEAGSNSPGSRGAENGIHGSEGLIAGATASVSLQECAGKHSLGAVQPHVIAAEALSPAQSAVAGSVDGSHPLSGGVTAKVQSGSSIQDTSSREDEQAEGKGGGQGEGH